MKLHKQAPLKAGLIALIAAMLGGFFALVKSETHVEAQPVPTPATPVDYGGFFAPNQPTPKPGSTSTPIPRLPHTRTRAS